MVALPMSLTCAGTHGCLSSVRKGELGRGGVVSRPKASTIDAMAFGTVIVLGGTVYFWDEELDAPLGTLVAGFLVASTGFLTLSFCIAEVSSFFAFGGGAFGYVRCIIHPALGFLTGAFELVEYILFVALFTHLLGTCCTDVFGMSAALEPVWWVIFYCTSLVLQVDGGRGFLLTNKLVAGTSIVVILLYFFSVAPSVNFSKFSDLSVQPAATGLSNFLLVLPQMALIFVGMESVVLAAEGVRDPNKSIPTATISSWLVLFVLSAIVILVSATSSPGIEKLTHSGVVFSMTPGFVRTFGWTSAAAGVLSFPSLFGTAYGFLYAAGKRVSSMAASRTLPSILCTACGPDRTPVAGLLLSSALGFCIQIVIHCTNPDDAVAMICEIAVLLSSVTYISMAYCYWICSTRYSNLPRRFTSPLGVCGAAVCALVFMLVIIGITLIGRDYQCFTLVGVMLLACVAIYFVVVRRFEYFSDAEVSTFMKAYVINANIRRREAIQRRNKRRLRPSWVLWRPSTVPGIAALDSAAFAGASLLAKPFCNRSQAKIITRVIVVRAEPPANRHVECEAPTGSKEFSADR